MCQGLCSKGSGAWLGSEISRGKGLFATNLVTGPLMEESLSSKVIVGDSNLLWDQVGSEGGWIVLGFLDLLQVGRVWSPYV